MIMFKPFFVCPDKIPTRTAVCTNDFSCSPLPIIWICTTAFSFPFMNRAASLPSLLDSSIHGAFSSVSAALRIGALTIPVTGYSVDFLASARNCWAISTATRC